MASNEVKKIELAGWDFPKHLAGRVFSIIVHGDAEGAQNVQRSLHDWLASMDMIPAGPKAEVGRYIGYYKPYATSHEDLDSDLPIQDEARNCALTLLEAAKATRDGRMIAAGEKVKDPRPK